MTRDCDDHSQSQAHAHQRGKTVQRWSEEQVRPCRRQQLSGRPGILTWWRQKYR
ncbi:unnamed protein product, partial [Staurois parvus]